MESFTVESKTKNQNIHDELKRLDDSRLRERHTRLSAAYKEFASQNLALDLSRGKPGAEQLDLSSEMMDCLSRNDYKSRDGIDCRNYGGVDGIPEAKELFAGILEARPNEIMIGGNSSLAMMHDLVARGMLRGLPGSELPWQKLPAVKFICPSPGYDRHYSICDYFGIEMITVDYHEDGPDMSHVENLVASDSSIKGIWCVPKYSNPTGITYSDEVVERLAAMPAKASDFRIFWDNAYAVHHLSETPDRLMNILEACRRSGNPDRAFVFSSTSKITFAGGGVAMMASSETNINWLKKQTIIQTIGPDKLNQLRHVRFFKDMAGIEAHMKRHAAIVKPKFDLVLDILDSHLGGKGIASWSRPRGGYFISLNTQPGFARRVVGMAAAAGVTLTEAGATFPHGKDPADRNIRIAATYPPLSELKPAMIVLALCIELTAIEHELSARGYKHPVEA
ncbi:MAG TPA: aminotransferase class I/II-fold pyridoxal phosphate-dependent enzyme [Candidatus Kryptonia bacterium]